MDATEQDTAAPLLGRLLDGRYRLDAFIARGGMATVYQATDTRLDRGVAVKVMSRALADDPDFVARFTREAKAAARVQVAEVVQVYDQGTDPGTGLAYLVMEHVRGITLRQFLQERGPQPPARAAALMEPVLRALAAAHAAGLVHRDIKPENVLVGDDGRVKVADFGLARAVESSNLTQTTGMLIGTVAYLAPEQVQSGSADARTDVYAAGVLFWELLTGTPPYAGQTPLSVAYQHVNEDVPPPSTAVADLPPALDELIVQATRRDPDARPADGGAFLTALQAVQRLLPDPGEPAGHPTLLVPRPAAVSAPPLRTDQVRVSPKPPRPRRPRRRRGLIALFVVLVLSLVALGSGYYLGSYRYTTAPSVLTLSLQDAEARLAKAGLTDRQGPSEFSETVGAGLVLKQDPEPGGKVRKDGTVTLVLSKGPDRRTIPDVTGKDVATATTLLEGQGLKVSPQTTSQYSATVAKDLVVTTSPGSGTKLRPGTVVRLVVSKGKEPVEVPDFTGRTQTEAERTLKALGFQVSATQEFSDQVAKGVVMAQDPKSGTADRGSTISLTVSKGPDVVTVPDVRGKQEDAARTQLEALGLKVKVSRFPQGPGNVVSQDPQGGKVVKRGASVRLYVF